MSNEYAPRVGARKPLLSVEEAEEVVGLSPNTLNNYRSQARGPLHRSVDGRIGYIRSDLEAWMKETDGLLDTAAAAELAGMKEKSFRNLRSYGTGPAFVRLKGQRGTTRLFYRPDDVIAWRDAR